MNDSTFGRLFIIMIIAMTILTVIIMILASLASSEVNAKLDEVSAIENSPSLSQRISPIGEFSAETVAVVVEEPVILSGEEAYASCTACHESGIAGAPRVGQIDAWSARIAQGMDILYDHAINGYTGKDGLMPAKGGNMALLDESVKAAVDFMVEKSQ